ncbi:STK25 [Enterospora canceri]|uniref:STK25 n=1 Tax=Enterospora canceri TaxID=1081671 RepID=A0A1Y1S645_9MICR|nr:STK25 [Enterospora canceri]
MNLSILCITVLIQFIRAATKERVKPVNLKLKKTLKTFLSKFADYKNKSMSLSDWNQVAIKYNLSKIHRRGNRIMYKDNSGAYVVKLSTVEHDPCRTDPLAFARKKINHPNIVKLHCWATQEITSKRKKRFILVASVYELCDVIIGSRLINNDENTIRSIVHQVLLGLDYLHSKKLVHLDIKPDNIMGKTGKNGKITYKLIDLDTIADLPPEDDEIYRQVFTSGYVDPEYGQNRILIESDIYQLGMTAWALSYMKKGDEEWCRNWGKKYNKKRKQHTFKSFSSVEYGEFVKTCTDYDPKRRPNCRELLLHPFITETGN